MKLEGRQLFSENKQEGEVLDGIEGSEGESVGWSDVSEDEEEWAKVQQRNARTKSNIANAKKEKERMRRKE